MDTRSIQANTNEAIEHPNKALDWALAGCAVLEAADGAGSLAPLMSPSSPGFSLIDAVQLTQPLSAAELRYHAVQYFAKAADAFPEATDAFPGKPWVWFQIGWYSFAYEDGPRDLRLAYSALKRVLDLDPDNSAAHLALAWLLRQEEKRVDAQVLSEATSTWDGPIGQHLRAALHPRLRSPLGTDIHYGRTNESGDRRWTFPYLIVQSGHSLMLQALEDLEAIVPDSHRFAYAMAHYHVATGQELRVRWLEEALKWPCNDDWALCEAHHWVAHKMIMQKRNLAGAYEHFVKAYGHMMRLAEHDRDSVIEFIRNDWLSFTYLPRRDVDLLQNAKTTFLKFVDVCLDIADRWLLDIAADWGRTEYVLYTPTPLSGWSADQLGELTALAGQILLDSVFSADDMRQAKTYLTRSLEYERMLLEYLLNNPGEPVMPGPRMRPVTVRRRVA